MARLGASHDRLDSWKAIASYVNREVRTVQLWEKREGMPVHRHFHSRLGTVFAFRSEIEAWSRQAARQHLTSEVQAAPAESPATDSIRTILVEPVPGACRAFAEQVIERLTCLSPALLSVVWEKNSQTAGASVAAGCSEYRLRWNSPSVPVGESNAVELMVNLLEAGTGQVLWSRAFIITPGAPESVARAADQIARCVWIGIISRSRNSSGSSRKTSAREHYLKGRYFQSRRDEEGLRKAVAAFRAAIELDPESASAYSGLADSLTLLSFYEIEPPSNTIPEARCAASHAIELDPHLAEARASMAEIHFQFDRDWVRADQEYRRAIECDPGYAPAYQWYANLLASRGEHEAAHTAILQALHIEPVSAILRVWAGVTSHLAHRFGEAVGYYRNALELDPHFFCAHMYMAQTLEQLGQYSAALESFERAIQLTGRLNCIAAMKAHALAVAGDHISASGILHELSGTGERTYLPSYDIAAAHAALGDFSRSIHWLRRACRERHMRLFSVTQDPRFDNMRHRIDFRRVIEDIGLDCSSSLPTNHHC